MESIRNQGRRINESGGARDNIRYKIKLKLGLSPWSAVQGSNTSGSTFPISFFVSFRIYITRGYLQISRNRGRYLQ